MREHRFLLIFLLFAIVSIIAGYGYGPASTASAELDDLKYTKGEFDYYQTKRKWKNRRRGDRPFRKYLIVYLEDDMARYQDGNYLLDNLEQNALLMIFNEWPRDSIEIGYSETDDAGLRIMYDIKYDGKSLVDLETVRSSMEREASVLLIFSLVGGVLSLLSLARYFYERKHQN